MKKLIFIFFVFCSCLSFGQTIKHSAIDVQQSDEITLPSQYAPIFRYDTLTGTLRVLHAGQMKVIGIAGQSSGGQWGVESFVNHSGATISVSGPLPTSDIEDSIRVTRGGVELTYVEDYTISGNTFTFTIALDGENVKIWYL